MKEFGSKGEVRQKFRLRTACQQDKEGCGVLDVSYVMKVLWKILCISCGEFASDEEDYWV